jgi:hypothetical protein
VSADLFRTEASHKADDEATRHRDEHRPGTHRATSDEYWRGARSALVSQIGRQVDQVQQPRPRLAHAINGQRRCGKKRQPAVGDQTLSRLYSACFQTWTREEDTSVHEEDDLENNAD